MIPLLPTPHIHPCVVKFNPSTLTQNQRVVMPSLRTSNMHYKALQDIHYSLTTLHIKILRQLDLKRKFNDIIQLNFIHRLQIKNQSLKVNKQKLRQHPKSMILLNGLHPTLTILAIIITNDLRLTVFLQTLRHTPQILNLH